MSRAFNLAMTGNSLATALPPTPAPAVGAFLSVGSLDLGNPVLQYLAPGASSAGWIPLTGGTLTGPLYLWGAAPGNPNEATPKSYVDTFLSLSGGTMTGAITLVADPQQPLQPATKRYADLMLPLTGGTLTGALYGPRFGVSVNDVWTSASDPDLVWSVRDAANNIAVAVDATGTFNASVVLLTADPTVNLAAATKQYVDARVVTAGSFLPLTGGTLTGVLTAPTFNVSSANDTWTTSIGPDLVWSVRDGAGNIAIAVDYSGSLLVPSGTPGSAGAAASKSYVDTFLPKTGGTMTGTLTLAGDPNNPLDAATRNYVDKLIGGPTAYVAITGSTMTGPLILNADPTNALGAVTKQYADSLTAATGGPYLSTKGGNMTGKLGVPDDVGIISSTAGTTNDVNNLIRQVTCTSLTPALLIGTRAGWKMDVTKAQGTLAIGYCAGGGALGGMSGGENTCIGYFSGRSLTTGTFCTSVGLNSMGLETAASSVTAIGCDAMRDSIGCDNSVAVGTGCHRGWDGPRNIAIGANTMAGGIGAGAVHAVGTDNIAIGSTAMRAANTASKPASTVTASRNVAIGVNVMVAPDLTSASDNVITGYNAASANQTGNGNIISGSGAAASLVSGNNNIILAAGSATIDVAGAAESGVLRIGANAVNTIRAAKIDTANPILFFDGLATSPSYVDDSTAASAGVLLHQLYRNGSQVMVRVT